VTAGAPGASLTSYRAAIVLPISGPPIRNGSVLVDGDRVAWAGPTRDHPAAPDARVVELGDAILTPGLVNAHTHLDLTVMRGLLDGLSFYDWIRTLIAARAQLTDADTLDSARLGAIEALECGVTTVADTAPTPASFDAMTELGLRGIAYVEAFGPDPAQAQESFDGLRTRVAALRPRESPLVRVGVSPHAPYSVGDDLYRAVAAFARTERLPLATHVAESDAESALVERGESVFADLLRSRDIAVTRRGRSPIALLDSLGVLGDNALLIHCVRCDDDDVAAIAAKRAGVAVCPWSNRYFAHGAAPVAAFVGAGVRVGVGTDSMASNSVMSPLREARAAVGALAGETPKAAWHLATIDGARALGLDSLIGTIEPGKQADLAAFAIPAGTVAPNRIEPGPAALLTVVAGIERVRHGRVTADATALRTRAQAASARLREWRAAATSA
jgi:5-methylthioadenosine/S-adenosylhomocysteine deaminase